MMGALIGLLGGAGILLMLLRGDSHSRRNNPLRGRLDAAGLSSVSTAAFIAASVLAAVGLAFLLLALSGVPALGLLGLVAGAFLPSARVAQLGGARREALETAWPDAVDVLVSAVRAGLSLPEAANELALRGPEPLRRAAARSARDIRAGVPFAVALDRFAGDLADPVADRVVETLRIAHEVGGRDLAAVLRTLGQFVRDDVRTRADIRSKQSWTVNAARMAVAAPWVTLALLSTRPGTLEAFRDQQGSIVLLSAAALSALAYWCMRRIARLPQEGRTRPALGPSASADPVTHVGWMPAQVTGGRP